MAAATAPCAGRTYRVIAGLAITAALALALQPLPRAKAADGVGTFRGLPPMPPPPINTVQEPEANQPQQLLPGQVVALQVVPFRE